MSRFYTILSLVVFLLLEMVGVASSSPPPNPRLLISSHSSLEMVLDYYCEPPQSERVILTRSPEFSDRTAPFMQARVLAKLGGKEPQIDHGRLVEALLVKTPYTNGKFIPFGGGAKVFEKGRSESWFEVKVPHLFWQLAAGTYEFRLWIPGYDWELPLKLTVEPFTAIDILGSDRIAFHIPRPGLYSEPFSFRVDSNTSWRVYAELVPLTLVSERETASQIDVERFYIQPDDGDAPSIPLDGRYAREIHWGSGSQTAHMRLAVNTEPNWSAIPAGEYRGSMVLTVEAED